jgi:hypothetical protein
VEKFFESVERITVDDRFVAVDGQVDNFLDDEDLGEGAWFQVHPENRFVDQGGQVVGIGLIKERIACCVPRIHTQLFFAANVRMSGLTPELLSVQKNNNCQIWILFFNIR